MSETLPVEGLGAEAEILVDRYGVPHIRAKSLDDLFLAQGFNAARDRLWQLDLWRKRGLGLLARDFGPGYLAQDRASRLVLYRGDMEAEWKAYASDARAICTRFVQGINAYIALCEREPERLPPEFGVLGTRPEAWAPEDVVRIRSHAITRNLLSEVLRARVLSGADRRTDSIRKALEPPVEPTPAGGISLASIPLDVLTAYKLATAGVTFSADRLAATLEEAEAWSKVTELGDVVLDHGSQGSNNWVVAPSRTATGRPILANDPHRAHGVPSLRYLVHLTAPGFDAIGAGEPVVPGVSIGHNGRVAFGLTIFYADQEDLYVYETDPDHPRRYRYGDGYQAMEVVEERFEVRGAPDQVHELAFTRHGPVLLEAPGRAYALRTVWSEPGTAAYLRSLAAMRAASVGEFREAARGWLTPSVNLVAADTSGTVAWMPAGATPVRPGWDGLLPVPGDGRFEWAGMLDNESLPRVVDPAKGFFATANEMNLPEGFPHPVGYEWVDRSRADRIHAVLGADRAHTVEASCRLQTDATSHAAGRVSRALARLAPSDGEAGRALAMLARWDGDLSAGSGPAALYEVWWTRHLKPALFVRLCPDPAIRALLPPGDLETLVPLIESPDDRFGPDPEAGLRDVVLATLRAAFAECRALMGDDPGSWAWGRLHRAYFEHPLTAAVPGLDPATHDIGPFPHGGDGSSPMHTGFRPGDFRTILGASVRMVVDVGDWDRSRWINAPGQSGDPRSPHYRDLAPVWAEGGTIPMLYSAAAVDAAVATRILLIPGVSPPRVDNPRPT